MSKIKGLIRKSGKSRKKEIKLGVIYEGWKPRNGSKDEYEVVNKTAYATFKNSKTFKALGEATLAEIYDVDEIETRIINGDGAGWIKGIAADQEDAYYQLDPFHRSQAIVRAIEDKKEREETIKLFNQAKVTEGIEYITQLLIKYNADERQFKKIETLFNYLVFNKSGLIPYNLREDLKLPKPPIFLEYKTLGTMESNVWNILAIRLKGMKRSWSNKGAGNLANVLTEKANKRINSIIDSVYRNVMSDETLEKFEDIVILS